MKSEISVLALHSAHAQICAALHRDAFAEPEQWSAAAFGELLSTPGIIGWIMTENAAPAGILLVRQCLDEAEILTIAVARTHQRKGLARRMMQESTEHLVKRGARCLFLEVSVRNVAATALYEGQGFVDCGLRRSYYSDGSDALVMRYDLHNEMR
ncbi:ribosomal protein S18-alanine N-acetyltransferase [Asaia bogorensis]|uniref:ribosomal protein S18-alanine N-acetyltransferase n=1 Tax=Asaia bogorensis TaxID=91915 RepID=UPI000EFC8CEE|nr:ribosomal protein S18-alanine N-acetyltransferase [Asaia bogorensis]